MAFESTNSPLLSVVVPAYNEAGRMAEPLELLQGSLEKHYGTNFEVLVVDDGSSDNTSQIADEMGAKVLTLPFNQGKGAALRSGMLEANGTAVRAFTDADGSIKPDDVIRLIDIVGETPADIAIAQRDNYFGHQHESRTRLVGSLVLGALFEKMLPAGKHLDTQCGAKSFASDAARVLFGQSVSNGFFIDREILHRAHLNGYSVRTLPLVVTPKEGSTVRPVRDAFRMFNETVKVRKSLKNLSRLESDILSSVAST